MPCYTHLLLLGLLLLLLPVVQNAVPDPPSALSSALSSFCTQPSSLAFAPCNLLSICQASATKSDYCHPVAIINSLCGVDAVSASICDDWKSSTKSGNCSVGGISCSAVPSWNGWPTSVKMQDAIFRMCAVHSMEGCEACPPPSNFSLSPSSTSTSLSNCASLNIYAKICNSMPEMTNCKTWANMCNSNPTATSQFPGLCNKESVSLALSDTSSGSGSTPGSNAVNNGQEEILPPMRMFFHQSERDIFLFRSFVTNSTLGYTLVCIFCIAFTVFYYFIQAVRIKLVPYFSKSIGTTKLNPKCLDSSSIWHREKYHLMRSALATAEVLLGFLLMLIVMTYNVGWIISILLGTLIGQWIFGRSKIGTFEIGVGYSGDLKRNVGDKDSLADGCAC